MDPETVHKLIHCNLQQLNLLHPASYAFKEGMFKVPNKKGFENVMHYLLNIVDPVKCAKMIPWPLLSRKGESQFRTSVKKFLMEINSDYPGANLPKIVSSFLMNPGGDKFAYFMWNLTKFVLLRSLCQTYGTSDILLPPRTFVNDPICRAKLSLVCALAESATQKAVSNQLKTDSLLSQERERQCHIQLSELAEAITKYENLLKEVVKDSLVSAEMKEKLCSCFDDTDVVAEWAGVVEAEGRVVEAIIHVLNKAANSVTNLLETIKVAEDNDACQLRLDPSSLNICTASINSMADDLKEIMKNAQSGKLSLSEFTEPLFRSQMSLIQHIVNNGLQDMSLVLPDLCSVHAEFKELAVMLRNVEAKLQETLSHAQSNWEALHKEFKTLKSECTDKTEVSSSIGLSIPDGAVVEDVYITDQTPDRGVTGNILSKLTKSNTVANIVIDPQLIQTPEFDRKFDSHPHLPDVRSTGKEYETPVQKHNYVLSATTSKKPHFADLRSLTKSLVRNKKTAETAAELHSVPRLCKKGPKARAAPAVNKELFEKSTGDTEEKLDQSDDFSTLLPVDGSFSVMDASEDNVLPSSVPENDLTSSPSSLFCSSEPAETEQLTNKQSRRKSLIDIIERYRKIRKNMELS